MAKAVGEMLGEYIVDGVVSIPYYLVDRYGLEKIELIGAGHPYPDKNSLYAGERALEIARRAGDDDLLIVLLSGGGSSLLEKPFEPITLDDLRILSKLLLESGMDIYETNIVRKHLSMVKGGRLASETSAGKIFSLIISDVPGDRVEYVASGPTSPDPTSYRDVLSVLKHYTLWDKVPENVRRVVEKGLEGLIPDTPKPRDPVFNHVVNHVIGSNIMVLKKLEKYLENHGYNVLLLTSRVMGESREAGKILGSIALEAFENNYPVNPPLAIILGGETSVRVVNPRGRGGRCQELVLSFLTSIKDHPSIEILCFDTDGLDGNTDVAGAYGGKTIWEHMVEAGDDPYRYLETNNTYRFFKKYGGHILTGPTGTNANLVIIILVNKR